MEELKGKNRVQTLHIIMNATQMAPQGGFAAAGGRRDALLVIIDSFHNLDSTEYKNG